LGSTNASWKLLKAVSGTTGFFEVLAMALTYFDKCSQYEHNKSSIQMNHVKRSPRS